MSWSVEHGPGAPSASPAGLSNGRRFRPGQLEAFRQGCLGVLQEQQFAPGSQGQRLWDHNLITRLLAVIETPEAMQEALRLVSARGWLRP